MKSITVSKDKLLETLKKNRNEHQAIYEQATYKFREEAIRKMESHLRLVKSGGEVKLFVNLSVPEDHTEAFDTAIAMLEWEEGDTIELDQKDFERYVKNKWEWERSFAANTMSYVQ